jgi:hypothetical protein
MEVFVVTDNVDYQGSESVAMFSTYEKAKAYIEKRYDSKEWVFNGVDCWNYYGAESEYLTIETFTVDEGD